MITKPPTMIVQGQAGVHRVASELLVRGIVPWFPSADGGVDLMADGAIRIQVKSTLRPLQNGRIQGTFSFTLSKAQLIQKQKYVPCVSRTFSAHCDFVVLWAIEANRFWIVPAAVLDGRWTVQVPPNAPQWRDLDSERIKAMQAEGYTIAAIAEHFGVAPRTVTRRLTTFETPKRNYADMAQYENRWDLITGALATLHEANEIAGPSRVIVNQEVAKT